MRIKAGVEIGKKTVVSHQNRSEAYLYLITIILFEGINTGHQLRSDIRPDFRKIAGLVSALIYFLNILHKQIKPE